MLEEEDYSWKHYVALNQKFADSIAEIYEPGDISKLFRLGELLHVICILCVCVYVCVCVCILYININHLLILLINNSLDK